MCTFQKLNRISRSAPLIFFLLLRPSMSDIITLYAVAGKLCTGAVAVELQVPAENRPSPFRGTAGPIPKGLNNTAKGCEERATLTHQPRVRCDGRGGK